MKSNFRREEIFTAEDKAQPLAGTTNHPNDTNENPTKTIFE
jgi:hypothetical protein